MPWGATGDGIPRSFGNSIAMCFRKYVDFTGRAPRAEYWWFLLFSVLISWPLSFITMAASNWNSGMGAVNLISLVFLLPSLAVAVRRLHDRDKSGWWLLLSLVPVVGGIILFVWYCMRGTHGANRFGPENGTIG